MSANGNKYGLFFNSQNGDRTYDADSFSEWLKKFFTTGVFSDEMQVTASSGMVVSVGSGYVNIEGKVRFFDSSTSLTIATAGATYPRVDTIVVERNDTNREITLKVVTGAYSGDSPVATAPVRDRAVYQIVLAQVYVGAGVTEITQSNITDKRADTSVCGIVTGTVEEMDFSDLSASLTASFKTWFDAMKGQLSADAAGNLQNQIDALASTTKNVTLSSSSWSNGSYTISDSLITATSNQEIIPSQSITADQYKALVKASLVATGQTAGSITIKAFGATPGIDIPVTIIFRGEK